MCTIININWFIGIIHRHASIRHKISESGMAAFLYIATNNDTRQWIPCTYLRGHLYSPLSHVTNGNQVMLHLLCFQWQHVDLTMGFWWKDRKTGPTLKRQGDFQHRLRRAPEHECECECVSVCVHVKPQPRSMALIWSENRKETIKCKHTHTYTHTGGVPWPVSQHNSNCCSAVCTHRFPN